MALPRTIGRLYPNFRKHVIDVYSDDPPHWLLTFPFRTRGKRKDDLVSLGLGDRAKCSDILYYEHPLNHDYDYGIDDESDAEKWHTLVLHSLKYPSSCMFVDVSENGFYDLIVTSEYGESLTSPDIFGGRISWLENFGTDEGDWACREIGRFPGVNLIKVGNFTTTFSLQILAIVKSSSSNIRAPLVIFTKPDNVYTTRQWLVNISDVIRFTAIQDVLVVNGLAENLDYIVISSLEGLSVAWYSERVWHLRPIYVPSDAGSHRPGQMCALRQKQDPVAYIVVAEAERKGILYLYSKEQENSSAFHDIAWTRSVLMDFRGNDCHATIEDLTCADMDSDGMDEILVSVNSQSNVRGIHYFHWEGGRFIHYKVCDESALKIVTGQFSQKNRQSFKDFATLSASLPREVAVHYNCFVLSHIRPFVENSRLVFAVPRISPFICEADVIDVAGFTMSLVLLPPDAAYNIASDCSDAVKVLHGSVAWIDGNGGPIERTHASGKSSCAISMLVDSPEAILRSGNDGAVFVRLRPSRVTDDVVLKALNVLPSYFPSDVCDFEFKWESPLDKAWMPRSSASAPKDLYHLDGFRLQFEEDSADFAYVHFWACGAGVSSGFTRQPITPWSPNGAASATICSIRACLSNPGGDGGVEICGDRMDWGTSSPTKHQMSRIKKTFLPTLHEQSPIWSARADDLAGDEVRIEYPWHAWVGGRTKRRARRDIWASFDFSASSMHSTRSDNSTCTIC